MSQLLRCSLRVALATCLLSPGLLAHALPSASNSGATETLAHSSPARTGSQDAAKNKKKAKGKPTQEGERVKLTPEQRKARQAAKAKRLAGESEVEAGAEAVTDQATTQEGPGKPSPELEPGTALGSEFDDLENQRDLPPMRAREALEGVLCHLIAGQKADGSWGVPLPDDPLDSYFPFASYFAWQQAAHALGLMALMEAPSTLEGDAALEAGIDWLCRSRIAHRSANWDVDSTWSSLYGFVCLVQAAEDRRFGGAASQRQIQRRGMEFYEDLLLRQTPDGGWAYYDDPPFTRSPKWATSFCTALVLPALLDAHRLGWGVDPEVARRAADVVRRCALPNGAYGYSYESIPRGHGGTSINQIPGSLGRIQVCNWALAKAGDPRITEDLIREGLEAFFEQHAYLDMARTRPVPHEGWFANAGYFYFFGHYYAAQAIELLPAAEREVWHRQLRYHITKTLTPEGTCADFLASSFLVHASSSYAALVLAAGLPADRDDSQAVKSQAVKAPTTKSQATKSPATNSSPQRSLAKEQTQ